MARADWAALILGIAGLVDPVRARMRARAHTAGSRETREAWRERLGDGPRWLTSEVSVLARRGRYAAADSVCAVYRSRYEADPDLMVTEGLLDAVRGRMTEARGHFDDAIQLRERAGDLARPVALHADLAMMDAVAVGDAAGATRLLEAAVARVPPGVDLAGTWIDVGLARALAGDPAGAREALDTLVAMGKENWSLVRGNLRAAIALAEDQPAKALALLEASETPCSFNASAYHRADPRWRRILAGRAREALGDPAGAIAEYDGYFSDPPATVFGTALDATFLLDTLDRLGRLHDSSGHRTEAASRFRQAAELWKDADPDLQPRVMGLRDRATGLASESGSAF